MIEDKQAKAVVGCVEFANPDEFKKAIPMLDFWNYHDRKDAQSEWHGYRVVKTEKTENGVVVWLTEKLTNTNDLVEVPENYRETDEYKKAVGVMARQAREYRESIEEPRREREMDRLI